MCSKLKALERKIMTVKQFSGIIDPGEYKVSCRLGILPWTSLMGRFASSICNQHQLVYIPFPEAATFSLQKVHFVPYQYKSTIKFILTDTFPRFSSLENQLGFCSHTRAVLQKIWAFTAKSFKPYLGHLRKTEHGRDNGKGKTTLSKCHDYLLEMHVSIVLIMIIITIIIKRTTHRTCLCKPQPSFKKPASEQEQWETSKRQI